MTDRATRRTRGAFAAAVAIVMLLSWGAVAAPSPVQGAATFVVNRIGDEADLNVANAACDVSTNSGNQCTLRAAIQEANDTPGADVINFNITITSKTITPATPLPTITGRVTINGYSQTNAKANTKSVGNDAVIKIVLDGVNAGTSTNGLVFDASDSLVKGLVIQRFGNAGIVLNGSGNRVQGNFIGTNGTATEARPNKFGVVVNGPEQPYRRHGHGRAQCHFRQYPGRHRDVRRRFERHAYPGQLHRHQSNGQRRARQQVGSGPSRGRIQRGWRRCRRRAERDLRKRSGRHHEQRDLPQ